MSTFKLKRNAFRFGGKRYFRGGAEDIRLGAYGVKRTPVGQANFLDVEDVFSADALREVHVHRVEEVVIDWEQVSEQDFGLNVKYLNVAGAGGTLSRQATRSADLRLIKLKLDGGPIKRIINWFDAGAREYLRGAGNPARVVSAVWVVMEAELAHTVATSVQVDVKMTANGTVIEAKASHDSTNTRRVTLPKGSTFAYMLHKVQSWRQGMADKVKMDQHGPF